MNTASTDDRPRILLCNDDGIRAPGIQALADALAPLGDLVVVAPESEQSAVGHAITVRDPVRAHEVEFATEAGPIPAWAVTGTPTDAVKLACHELLEETPDLVVSGINDGPNTAVNVLYSGTVSAATEASILGLDAVAVSLCEWDVDDFSGAERWARRIVRLVLRSGLPDGVLLNVNVPYEPEGGIQGVAVTRQARSRWEEGFDTRTDPADREYYWLAGTFVDLDDGDRTDTTAVEEGYVSVTPLQHDLTAHDTLSALRNWNWASDEDAADEPE
ncbi:MAG: 5'/3'-nucleotidase SurE [Bacteroidetes bacterium SW_9_63_38]|nr:MAG: 5'/3'-nucleotidase SurE [Bacteroidetes bacterium SW_9_63_38]